MKDFLIEKVADQDNFIVKVFGKYKEFEKELTKVFGDTDEKIYT